MSVYSVRGKGWRYDFTIKGTRHTEAWFKTKAAARKAEEQRKEEIRDGQTEQEATTPADMAFLELVNRRLDHVKAYNSAEHYRKFVEHARRWVQRWTGATCREISRDMVQEYILERSGVSPYAANKEIRYLRSTFNFGLKRKWIAVNPLDELAFLPEERKLKYVPPTRDIDKIIDNADMDTQDYLWTIRETLARVNEVNRLTWDDVLWDARAVVLYTRKKRGGHKTPRKVYMTDKLHEILIRRYRERDPEVPWVFDHSYRDRKAGKKKTGAFLDRRKALRSLCERAGVRPFGFHALRHAGASVMDNSNVPIGVIQRILGHENRSTTEIYLHGISQAEQDAMRVYEQSRKNSHTDSHTAQSP